jgi:hypothetical protein
VFKHDLAQKLIKKTDRLLNQEIDLAIRANEARELLDWSVNNIETSWLDWMDSANAALKDVTMLRMAIERETKFALTAAKDVREFFSGAAHEQQISRLKEFVETLERLKRLRDDGFLDAVADTILRMEERRA